MRVGLNLVFLVPGETGGMEVYARELIPRLAALDGIEPIAFVNREAAEAGGGPWGEVVPMRVVPVRARNRVEWVRGEQQYVPRLAARERCDVLHSLSSTAPLWGSVPRITTIHDISYKLQPETHFGLLGLGMSVLVPGAARRSKRILVDAAATREDLVTHLHTPAAKIDVVPLGVTPRPPVTPTPEPELRAKLQLGDRPLLLSVSAKRPHKNLLRLIEAVARIPDERRPKLVLPGYATPHEAELRERAQLLRLDVAFPAWVSAEDLEGLYAAAAGFAFPSLHEGFGLPVLEAMARGVPVATSGRASLAEVAGDAALLFDPESVDAIAQAIEQLLGSPQDHLREAGRAQAAAFTWERTAELTAAAYERTIA